MKAFPEAVIKNQRLSFFWSISSAYFFFLGPIIVLIQVALARKIPFLFFFNIGSNGTDLKCSWQCLGTPVAFFILSGGFRLGVFLFLAFIFLRALLRLTRRLKETTAFQKRLESSASSGSQWGVNYFVFPFAFPLALTAGWFKPRIFLSTSLLETLSQEELKTVLFHEAFHQKRRDPLRSLLFSFLFDLVFFLPFTKKMSRLLGVTNELRADFFSLEKGQKITSLLTSLHKMYNFRLLPELNLSHYSAVSLKDLDRLHYFSQGKLKPEISKLRLAISAMIIVILSFLAFARFGLSGERLIHEHHLSCTVHPIINEELKL